MVTKFGVQILATKFGFVPDQILWRVGANPPIFDKILYSIGIECPFFSEQGPPFPSWDIEGISP